MGIRRNRFTRFVGHHWLSIFFIIAMCLSIWASYISWHVSHDNIDQNKLICANVIENRDSQRLLWDTILIRFNPNPQSPNSLEFKRLLDDVLPFLKCVNNVPTPVGELNAP